MQLIKLSLITLLSSYTAAQDIDDNDVPQECRGVCQAVTQLTQQCDAQNDDDDSGYINCVCAYSNAATLIPTCEACVANYDRNDGHDNDVNDLVRSCSFTTTAFVAGAGTSGSVTTTPVSTGTTTLSGGNVQTTTATSTGAVAGATTNSLGAPGSTVVVNVAPSSTGNAAAGISVEMGLVGTILVAALGLFGLA